MKRLVLQHPHFTSAFHLLSFRLESLALREIQRPQADNHAGEMTAGDHEQSDFPLLEWIERFPRSERGELHCV